MNVIEALDRVVECSKNGEDESCFCHRSEAERNGVYRKFQILLRQTLEAL